MMKQKKNEDKTICTCCARALKCHEFYRGLIVTHCSLFEKINIKKKEDNGKKI